MINKNDIIERMAGRRPDFYQGYTSLYQVGSELRGSCPIHGGDGAGRNET